MSGEKKKHLIKVLKPFRCLFEIVSITSFLLRRCKESAAIVTIPEVSLVSIISHFLCTAVYDSSLCLRTAKQKTHVYVESFRQGSKFSIPARRRLHNSPSLFLFPPLVLLLVNTSTLTGVAIFISLIEE